MYKYNNVSYASMQEVAFAKFLDKNNIKFEPHPQLKGCRFYNKRDDAKTDFLLTDYNLYVEVKGEMTLFEVNKMKYIYAFTDYNYYVMQMTCEDWVSPDDGTKDKIPHDTNIQEDEILKLVSGKMTAEGLCKVSRKRLYDYIATRERDIANWIK